MDRVDSAGVSCLLKLRIRCFPTRPTNLTDAKLPLTSHKWSSIIAFFPLFSPKFLSRSRDGFKTFIRCLVPSNCLKLRHSGPKYVAVEEDRRPHVWAEYCATARRGLYDRHVESCRSLPGFQLVDQLRGEKQASGHYCHIERNDRQHPCYTNGYRKAGDAAEKQVDG